MTFQEVLAKLRNSRLEDSVLFAWIMAEQIEANRVAIEELNKRLDEEEDDTQDDDRWDLDQQLT